MTYRHPAGLLCLLGGAALAQSGTLPGTTGQQQKIFPADKQPVDLPAATLLLQVQRQPARALLTLLDQLRTVVGVQVTPYDGHPGGE